MERRGGLQPAPALWNGIREGEGKGTSPNRGPTGPSPPPRAPVAGAEFRVTGCGCRAGPRRCTQKSCHFTRQVAELAPGPAGRTVSRLRNCKKLPGIARNLQEFTEITRNHHSGRGAPRPLPPPTHPPPHPPSSPPSLLFSGAGLLHILSNLLEFLKDPPKDALKDHP